MPTYDYVCHHCGHRFEVIHGVHADGPSHCPVCHSTSVRKGFAAPAVHFKGSGWAKKDRGSAARKSAAASADTSPAAPNESAATGASPSDTTTGSSSSSTDSSASSESSGAAPGSSTAD